MLLFSSLLSNSVLWFVVLLIVAVSKTNSLNFAFNSFSVNNPDIHFERDAFVAQRKIQVTINEQNANLISSVGRASYNESIRLYNAETRELTDFTTHFSFIIRDVGYRNSPYPVGDGLAFFISPFNATLPANSSGGSLGLFRNDVVLNASENQIVAIEFDTYPNSWDPISDHVGINVNSIQSVAYVTWNSSMNDGRIANAWISYKSSTQNLSVYLTYADNPVFNGESSLYYIVDLRNILPARVRVGFAASTGINVEIHEIISWNFTSSLEEDDAIIQNNDTGKTNKTALVIGFVVGAVCICCIVLLGFLCYKKRKQRAELDELDDDLELDVTMDDEFEKGRGPKRFTYAELSHATNDFSEDGKLGEGGFGGVYKGLLSVSNTEVAVKRISRGSKQGKKEYVSEVKVISRLRHRNLVQLIGWCHIRDEFMLVYEYMPNGSLDHHLFNVETVLPWELRYKIALGLASALLYLHEEAEQCVVHRDIKSSNVMLDSNFNAKLGDFGLARFVDDDIGSQTTVVAGTRGYLSPEYVTTGKASTESDVYSFGVALLEIACGRRPVEPKAEPGKVLLVEWAWDLYGRGQVLEAADGNLGKEYDEMQVQCLIAVGLWCCHPDNNLRPSIRQAMNVIKFEAPLPNLPAKLPVPMYAPLPMNFNIFSGTSSSIITDSEKYNISSHTSFTTGTSTSYSTSKPLLHEL